MASRSKENGKDWLHLDIMKLLDKLRGFLPDDKVMVLETNRIRPVQLIYLLQESFRLVGAGTFSIRLPPPPGEEAKEEPDATAFDAEKQRDE